MPNIFELYLTYTKRKEPPPNFQAWSAIAVMSAVLGKKCYVPQGSYTIYPNLNIVLVGAPGSRKTTSMVIGRSFVEPLGSVPVAPDSVTRESLIDDMAASQVPAFERDKDLSYWQASAFVSELEQFLGGRHINQQMVGFLTAIWDANSFKERTRKGGEVHIKNPYFTLLGCCTLSWMNEKLRSDIISDGFTRRTIFCLEEKMNCSNDWPTLLPAELMAAQEIRVQVARIHALAGKFSFTIPARVYYKKRYDRLQEDAARHSEKVQYYFSSKHNLAMKIAMCLSAVYRNDRVVDSHICKLAWQFLDESERNMDKIFSGVGQNTHKALADKILDKIVKAGEKGITHQKLLEFGYNDLRQAEFDEVVKVLEVQGKIVLAAQQVDAPPVYRVAILEKPQEVVNLLELASRTTPVIEPIASDLLDVSGYHLPDLVETSAEPPQESVQSAVGKVVLRPGKQTESAESLQARLVKDLGLSASGDGPLG